MFPKILRTSILALVVTIGGMAATTVSSHAGTGYIDLGIGGPGIYFSGGRGYRNHYRGQPRYERRNRDRRYGRRLCAPNRALRKARRFGIRHAHVARVNRRVIVVKGFRYGNRAKIIFSRSRQCPVIGYRNINF